MEQQNYFQFNSFKLNLEQTHNTANQLHETLEEFRKRDGELCGLFDNEEQYHEHLIGKLAFFIDLYTDCELQLHINETVVVDNYRKMLQILTNSLHSEFVHDLQTNYECYILEQIRDIFDRIASEAMSLDDAFEFIKDFSNLNFQEQQFIVDCFYSTIRDYKFFIETENGLEFETDYYNTTYAYALKDFMDTHSTIKGNVVHKLLLDLNEVHTSEDAYVYLSSNYNIDLDFIRDYQGLNTIAGWLHYIIDTLEDVNADLHPLYDREYIQKNGADIALLRSVLRQLD